MTAFHNAVRRWWQRFIDWLLPTRDPAATARLENELRKLMKELGGP